MDGKMKIVIYRNESVEEFTKKLSNPNERAGAGSASAASAALAASMLERAAASLPTDDFHADRVDWLRRNTKILREYMVRLIDEDVKCHGPLRRAMKEEDDRAIEAARQAAISICLEIINMMGQCLDLAYEMVGMADQAGKSLAVSAASLAFGASRAAGVYVLSMSRLSPDETYRYVIQRENELTMQVQEELLNKINLAFSAQ